MDYKELKKIFCEMGKNYGFSTAYGTCYMESTECMFVLELQKSNYSNLYYLNMKFYIQGCFGLIYKKNKDTLKNDYGSEYTRPPKKYLDIFDLDVAISDRERIEKMNDMFNEFIVQYSKNALSLEGIKKLVNENKLEFLPIQVEELNRLIAEKQQRENS